MLRNIEVEVLERVDRQAEENGPDRAIEPAEHKAVDVRPIESLVQDDFDRDVWCLLGLPVDMATVDAAVSSIDQAIRDRTRLSFVTPNVNWLVRAMRDRDTRAEILNADRSFIDGAPLIAFAKALDVPAPARVAGSDLFEALRRRPGFGGNQVKVFFFGGRDGSAAAAAAAVNKENGGVRAVGHLNPGFGDLEEISTPEIIDAINAADPDFIVVALGAAKGQAWIERNQDLLSAPVIAHLGAVVDFTGGAVARAPEVFQRLGLEWAWRIKEDPSLWTRYFGDALSLAKLSLMRFVPQLRAISQKSETSSAELIQEATHTTVKLTGGLSASNLGDVRRAFRAAAARGQDVRLDFSAVSGFDRAFLGLVLMLEKHVSVQDCEISVSGLDQRGRALFLANDLRYREASAEGSEFDVFGRSAAIGSRA